MKKNLVSVIVVVALFAALGVFALGAKKNDDSNGVPGGKDAASAVKICPNTGLPCTDAGDCEEECDEEEILQPVATSPESAEE